ncbi:MAG: helix-turn-helix transcriptional regulator [Treponema sp.]|jgi:putative molybdopterin biosynthesis protein|nr:helix-turn-helix transcriptional regulator [Treponema sp.]
MELLTAEDVAKQLRIKKYTVYELIKRGELPSSKVGKQVRISQADIDRYLRASKTACPWDEAGESSPPAFPAPRTAETDPLRAVILCGQDRCLDLLLARITGLGDMVYRSYMGCYNGLNALYLGRVTMAASHLWDSETGGYNYPFIVRLLPGVPVGVLRLAGRMQGFYVKKGNPLKIQDWQDLARPDLKIINRERGCGTRILLDEKLRLLGIRGASIQGYGRESPSHIVCAGTVAKGGADLGCGCQGGAENIAGVDFIPLQLEWYDLVFRLADKDSPAVKTVLSYVGTGEFTQDLKTLGSYDSSQTGYYREL